MTLTDEHQRIRFIARYGLSAAELQVDILHDRDIDRQELLFPTAKVDFPILLSVVKKNFTHPATLMHGERHWQQVAWIGSQLSKKVTGANPLIILLFSVLHDSMRFTDEDDPEHGIRAGIFARTLNGVVYHLSSAEMTLLQAACFAHCENDTISHDPTIGVCWDADRLNLWRDNIEPDPRWLSTVPAKDPSTILWAKALTRETFTWNAILSAETPLD